MPIRHRISIAREQYKFSCGHMTVFPDGRKERLHGHNYTVAVAIELCRIDHENMLEFDVVRTALVDLCSSLRERTLLARDNPRFELVRDDGLEIEFRLCGQRYVLPRQDVLLLPIDNVSVEQLAAYATEQLAGALRSQPVATALEVTIEESPGQGASCYRSLRDP
jgi:6-pyruvoyltetrahydropterin/6-carboxytetrahydropterin synthase